MSEFDLLVVEDESVVVRAARRVLEPEQLTIDAVTDGDAARDRLRHGSYRVILLDLMIPGVAGLELLEAAIAEQPSAPVIVTTGYATAQKTVAAFKAGAFDFLPKPFDSEELSAIVRRGLRWSQSGTVRAGGDREPAERDPSAAVHCLGAHSWARFEDGALATLGATESFVASIDASLKVRLPASGEETTQGVAFAFVEGAGSEVHRIWAPLSGRVVGCNETLDSDPDRLRRDPLGDGWLTKIAPSNLEEELNELTAR